MANKKAPHRCPGHCGSQVPHHLFACGGCWGRLPTEFQQPILDAARGTNTHLMAMRAACDWYRENETAQQPADEQPTD